MEIDVLRAAANTIGAAIQRKRAEAEVRHWAEVISTLLDLTEIIGSTLDIPQVLTRLIMAADVLLPAERVVLFLWDEQQNVLAPYRPQTNHQAQQPLSFELYENFPRLYLSPAEIPLIQELQSKMEAIAVAEASKSPLLPQEVVNTYHVRSFLAVPIVFRDRFTGALYADYTTSSHTFSKVETDLAMALARQAALAIERARLFEASEQRFQEAETLRQAGAIVTSTIQEDEAIKLIMEQLAHVVPCDSASVQLIREGALEIVGGYGWLEPEQVIGIRFPVPGDNPNTIVVQEGKPYILENAPEQYPAFKEDPHNRILSWLGVPLVVHDQVIGILAMDSHQYSYFTPNHVRLVTAFAGQVAIVIENARLYAAEKIRVQQLDALRATAADILAELEPSRLIQTMLERAVSLLGATAGELGKYLEQTDELEIVASHQMGIDSTGMHMAMGEGVMGRSAELLQPLVVNNYKDWEGRSPQYAHTAWQTVMASPLLAHGKLVGVIAIMDTDANRKYGRSELQLLTLFAQQAAIAVENARLYQEARKAAERRAILHQVSQEVVTKGSDREKICQAVHHAASRLMQVEAFAITLLDKEHNEVEGIYLVDKDGRHDTMRIPADQGLSGKVISTGKSLSIGDFAKEMNANVVHFGSPEHTRSILAVPLRLGDRILGMVTAQTYQPYAYTNEDLNLLEMLAANAAFAIENARLFEEIQWLAITDPLTELYNRRGFFELGEREVERFRRFGRPLSAIMLDIDHFKAVNDTYGHSIGNQVLVGLAKSLKKNIREIDIIGRYGGEEIVIVLPETHLEGGILVAERLRRIVESTPFSTDRGMVGVTVSEGVAEFMENIPDLAILLDQADSAMYAAKQGGRNQVRAYPVK